MVTAGRSSWNYLCSMRNESSCSRVDSLFPVHFGCLGHIKGVLHRLSCLAWVALHDDFASLWFWSWPRKRAHSFEEIGLARCCGRKMSPEAGCAHWKMKCGIQWIYRWRKVWKVCRPSWTARTMEGPVDEDFYWAPTTDEWSSLEMEQLSIAHSKTSQRRGNETTWNWGMVGTLLQVGIYLLCRMTLAEDNQRCGPECGQPLALLAFAGANWVCVWLEACRKKTALWHPALISWDAYGVSKTNQPCGAFVIVVAWCAEQRLCLWWPKTGHENVVCRWRSDANAACSSQSGGGPSVFPLCAGGPWTSGLHLHQKWGGRAWVAFVRDGAQ